MTALRPSRVSRPRASTRLLSPLSLAIAAALCAGAAPVMADERDDAARSAALSVESAFRAADRAALRGPFGQAPGPAPSGNAPLAGGTMPAADVAPSTGAYHLADGSRTDDLEVAADSWRNDAEFQGDWGLGTIRAEYAYARGLTGAGIRLGVTDSGTDLSHPEFAGKDHRALTMAQMLEDGSRCSEATLGGPGACFFTRGDETQVLGTVGPSGEAITFTFEPHGTHVAGTVAANRDGNGMHGVAFGADLSVARMFGDTCSGGPCGSVTPIAGASEFDHMYEQAIAQGVKVMNHSWGVSLRLIGGVGGTPEDARSDIARIMEDPASAAIYASMADASRSSGMIQVVAAGNWSFFDLLVGAVAELQGVELTPDLSPEPGMPAALPVVFPDIEPYWVSVVNVGKELTLGLHTQSMKCGISASWCIAAPGTDIDSTIVTGAEGIAGRLVTDDNGNLRYEFANRAGTWAYALYGGTSMAAPHVTGAMGLLMERFPYLSGVQVRDVMLTTATDIGPSDVYGWGLLNLEKGMEGYGSLRVDTDVVMNQKAGGVKVWEGGAWDDWTNDIGGPGKLTKSGIGWLRLSGDNSFNGAVVREGMLELDGANTLTSAVEVQGGQFLLNGSLVSTALTTSGGVSDISGSGVLQGSDLRVEGGVVVFDGLQTGGSAWVGTGGRLGGTGTLGDTTIAAGGTVAPGRSIGTLTVDGNYVQQPDSFFEVEMTPPDQVDQLAVTGTATLEGGTLVAQRGPGVYALGEQYTFLTAQGGLTGTFDALDTTEITPFLGLSLAYGANDVVLDVARGASFASAGLTHNQRVTGAGLDALADSNPLVGSLVQLFPADARPAMDLLSGDVHATAQSVLIDTSRHVRGTALARAGGGTDPLQAQQDPDRRIGAWVDIQRNGGRLKSDGNAAGTEYSGGNTLLGLDYVFDSGLRVGVLGGFGESDLKASERQHARTDLDARYAGVYAGYAWRGLGLKGGWTYGMHDVDVERTVAYPGFEARPFAAYEATTRQAFVEAGYRFGNAQWGVEPYAQFAQVRASADAFTETGGGAAALRGQTRDVRADLTTGGVRFDVNLRDSQQEATWVGLRGGVGYRKTGGELVPWTDVAFAGGDSFTVHGARVASDAKLLELGVAARTSANSLLEVGYQGQYADEARDHGANLRWSLRF